MIDLDQGKAATRMADNFADRMLLNVRYPPGVLMPVAVWRAFRLEDEKLNRLAPQACKAEIVKLRSFVGMTHH